MYETKISNKRWIAYDIPGNIGWISYLAALIREWKAAKQDEKAALTLESVSAVGMLCGIAELISERFLRLDRILPKARLYRGFGLLTLSGLLGMAAALLAVISGKGRKNRHLIMTCGGALCAVFSGLLFVGYRKVRDD